MSLSRKFLLAVASSIIGAIAILTLMVARSETVLISKDYARNAEIISTAIRVAMHDNMLGGRPGDTLRLIGKLKKIEGVQELTVLKADGENAFGLSGPSPDLPAGSLARLRNGENLTLSHESSYYLFNPLMNSSKCRECHSDEEKIRGILLVKISSTDMLHSAAGLLRRMLGFGLVTALFLSGLLGVMSRRLVFSPLRGLTEAARQLSLGNYVLYRPRSTHCHDRSRCATQGCPSREDLMIPCWLQSGTLCSGELSGKCALQSGDCKTCRVYKEHKGDEIVQLQDAFNRASLMLEKHERDTDEYIKKSESLNHDLTKSNAKLSTLLDASRLTTSTLEPERTLSSSLKILLDATNLKAGAVLLLDEDPARKCYEFFSCPASDCPAYRSEVDCWRLFGTTCSESSSAPDRGHDGYVHVHSRGLPVMNPEEKFRICSHCQFFTGVALTPRMISGAAVSSSERRKVESTVIHSVLLTGQAFVNHPGDNPLGIPIDTVTELALPLKINDRTQGIIYLASDSERHYAPDEINYFQSLADIMSSGIFNSLFLEEMENSYFQTVIALSNAIEAKDPYTKGHSERVAELCAKVAEAMNLGRQDKEHLRFAAILHDIGKIGVGRELLSKKNRLSDSEEFQMRSHPEWGVQILKPVRFLRPILSTIRHHHERFDGSGYPLGLKGRDIPLNARIICIADAWDAMRSDRPYRNALSVNRVVGELRENAGTQFDPELAELALRLFGTTDE